MPPSLAVIILNYRRPQNIGVIAAAAREALPEAPVFILDQSERDGFRERDDVPWSDVWVRRAEVNRGAGARMPLAAGLPFDLYLAIDDDILLTPRQIGGLVERLRAEPDRAHGVWGQRLELNQGTIVLTSGMTRVDAAMSMLNQVYAFSKAQAVAAIHLSARLGFASWDDVGPVDDILLSCASPKPPLCHDLGDIAVCPTSNQPGIAVWKSEGFINSRLQISRRLIAAQSIAVFSPLTVKNAPA
jgi:hypothetical protein